MYHSLFLFLLYLYVCSTMTTWSFIGYRHLQLLLVFVISSSLRSWIQYQVFIFIRSCIIDFFIHNREVTKNNFMYSIIVRGNLNLISWKIYNIISRLSLLSPIKDFGNMLKKRSIIPDKKWIVLSNPEILFRCYILYTQYVAYRYWVGVKYYLCKLSEAYGSCYMSWHRWRREIKSVVYTDNRFSKYSYHIYSILFVLIFITCICRSLASKWVIQ